MGAVKAFYMDCAKAGRCPISRDTLEYLSDIESIDATIDWIGYCKHDYIGRDGRSYIADCITMESANRLVNAKLANWEIGSFVDNFGDYCPA